MTTIEKTIFLRAAPDEVWSFLTDPEKLALWFHKPKAPLAEGADYALYGASSGNKVIWGKVNAARPPEYLEYTFEVGPMEGASSTVAWTLHAVPGGTQLHLRHSGLPEGEAAFGLLMALDEGWDEHLGKMRAIPEPAVA